MSKYFTNWDDHTRGTTLTSLFLTGDKFTRRGTSTSPDNVFGLLLDVPASIGATITPLFKRRHLTVSIGIGMPNVRQGFSYNAVDSDAGRADADVVVAMSGTAVDSWIIVRGQGTASITDGYMFAVQSASNRVRIYKLVGGVRTNPFIDLAVTLSSSVYRMYRFRINGAGLTTLQVKSWADGTPEPSAWDLTVTDGGSPANTLTAAGYIGIGLNDPTGAGQTYCNFLSVGTGGDSAPVPVTNYFFNQWLDKPNERCHLCEAQVTGYDGTSAAATRNVYMSNMGFASQPQDSPASTYYRPAIKKLPTLKREIGMALNGQAKITYGSLVVHNGAYGARLLPSFDAPLLSTVVPLQGSGPTSFARALTAYVKDWEGLLKLAKAGEVRFEGARRVCNLIQKTEDFSQAIWVVDAGGTGSVAVKTPNYALAPDGTNTACRVECHRGAGVGYSRIYNQTLDAFPYVARSSVYMRTTDGSTKQVALGDTFGTYSLVTVTGTWQRFSSPLAAVGGVGGGGFSVLSYDVMGGDRQFDVLVWHPMYEDVVGQSNQNPSEYVSNGVLASPYHGAMVDGVKYFETENGNTVASNVVTEATGPRLATLAGYRKERAASSICQQSQTFDNASWSKNLATVTANLVAAPDGTTTADKIIPTAVLGDHYVNIGIATLALTPYVASVYAKAAGYNFLRVQAFDGTNFFYQVFNLATGAVGATSSASGYTATSATITALPNGWYRCEIRFTTLAILAGGLYFVAENADSVATFVGDAASGVYVWGAQYELGSVATSYIPTVAATVTRPEDQLVYPVSNINNALGSAYAEYASDDWANASVDRVIGDGDPASAGATVLFARNDQSGVGTYDQTTIGLGPASALVTNGTRVNGASVWGATTMQAFASGVAGTAVAFDGSMGLPSVGIGIRYAGSAAVSFQGTIRRVQLYKRKLTGTEVNRLPGGTLGVVLDDQPIGERDDWLRMKWVRDYVYFLLGDPSWARHDFRRFVIGRLQPPTAPSASEIQFDVQSLTGALDQPFRTKRFAAGTPSPNQLEPWTVGALAFMEPVLTTVGALELEMSPYTGYTAPTDAYDNGVSLTTTLYVGSIDTAAERIYTNALGSPSTAVAHGLATDARIKFPAGAPAPLVNGTFYYVVNPTTFNFQVSATRGGAAINLTGTTPEGTVFNGYGWWPDANGNKIMLVSNPAGRIMVKNPNFGGFGASTPGRVLEEIFFPNVYAATYVSNGQFSLPLDAWVQGSMTALPINDECGFQIYDENMTSLEVAEKIARGTLCWFGETADGFMQAGRITLPAAPAVRSFTEAQVRNLQLQSLLLPANRTSLEVQFNRNWYRNGVLNLSPDKLAALQRQYETAVSAGWTAGTVPLDNFPQNASVIDLPAFDTLFVGATAGANEITRLETLYAKLLGIFTFQTKVSGLYRDDYLPLSIGDTIALTHSRYGWKSFAAGETSPDATAAFDGTLAVVLATEYNPDANDPFPVKLTVFRQLPGYYPTANP